MDIKVKILDIIDKESAVTTNQLMKACGFSHAYIVKILNELINEHRVARAGQTNKTRYFLADNQEMAGQYLNCFNKTYERTGLEEDVVFEEIKRVTKVLTGTPENVLSIINYAFTEMLNNAIDHSRSEKIKVEMNRAEKNIDFSVTDWGIGIFNNIKEKKKLKNDTEALQDLLKGKQTTDKERHSGEGIFFTSKIADKFIISSFGLKLEINNLINDLFAGKDKKFIGTKIFWQIDLNSHKKLTAVFSQYTDNNLNFSKTEILVELFKINSPHISRSEAKRLLVGLEKFNTVILDFKGIEMIGQGFADEIFRVWQKNHPLITIKYINADPTINMMIKRTRDAS